MRDVGSFGEEGDVLLYFWVVLEGRGREGQGVSEGATGRGEWLDARGHSASRYERFSMFRRAVYRQV